MQKQLSSLKDAFSILKMKEPKKISPEEKADIIFRASCSILGFDPLNLPIMDRVDISFQKSPIALYSWKSLEKRLLETGRPIGMTTMSTNIIRGSG